LETTETTGAEARETRGVETSETRGAETTEVRGVVGGSDGTLSCAEVDNIGGHRKRRNCGGWRAETTETRGVKYYQLIIWYRSLRQHHRSSLEQSNWFVHVDRELRRILPCTISSWISTVLPVTWGIPVASSQDVIRRHPSFSVKGRTKPPLIFS